MQELKLTRPPKLRVTLDEKEYLLTKPKVESAMQFTESLAKSGETSGLSLMRDLIISCGMPEDVVNGLELELIEAVGESLMPKKKS